MSVVSVGAVSLAGMTVAVQEHSTALAWTHARPSQAGYYWLRQGAFLDIVCVDAEGGVMHFYDENGPQPLASEIFLDAAWAGPIPRPQNT